MKRDFRECRNLLAVRLDAMGDLVMTSPALVALSDGLGASGRLTLLTSPEGARVAPILEGINDLIAFRAPWIKGSSAEPGEALAMIEELRSRRFDGAIIFTVYSQSPLPAAMLCRLAGISRIAAHCRENPYDLLTHWVPEPEPEFLLRHEAKRQLDLVGALGFGAYDRPYSVKVPNEAKAKVDALVAAHGLGSKSWIVCHPGATAPSRRYPPPLFAEALDHLAEDGVVSVTTGAKGDVGLAAEVARSCARAEPILLAGELTLPEFAALLRTTPALLSNNTLSVHLASAFGTPTVVLYALTNPQHTPWMTEAEILFHDVPCRFCYKSVCPLGTNQCLNAVMPRDVARAAMRLLGRKRRFAKAGEPLGKAGALRAHGFPQALGVLPCTF